MKSQNRQLLEELFTLKKACENKDEELTELREKVFCRNLIIVYRLLLLKGLNHSGVHGSVQMLRLVVAVYLQYDLCGH